MASDLQVFQDTVAHRRPARIPYHFSCTPDLDRRLKEHLGGDGRYGRHYGCFGCWGMGPKRPPHVPPLDFVKYWAGQELPPGTFINGFGVAEVPSGFYHFTGYLSPLRHATSLRELEEFPIDDLAQFDCAHYPEMIRQARAEGRPTSTWAGHMYEIAWQVRGYEEFLTDLIERPAWAECLLERLFRNNLFRAVQAARAGLDAIYCGDDVANQQAPMFSLPMWRHFMLSRWRQVWQAAKEIKPDIRIHYHSDGNVTPLIPDLVEAGVEILNPVQPECLDTDAIFRRFGERLCFDGCIGTQSTMPFGTPAQVRARVRECIEKYGRQGGLILSPTHVLEPEVPIANIEAFVAACREFGA